MALALDASTPARATGNNATTITTAAFTPPVGALLVVCTSGSGSGQNNPLVTVSTITGSTSAWTELGRATGTTTGSANDGLAAVHWATVTSSVSTTVRSTQTSGSTPTTIMCYVITGFDTTTPVGNMAIGTSNQNILVTSTLTTTRNNVWAGLSATEWANPSTAPTTSDLAIGKDIFIANGVHAIRGFDSIATSGTAKTFTLDGTGTGALEWMWVTFEVYEAVAANPKTQTLTDDFATDNRATKWPGTYGTTAVSGGVATVSPTGATDYAGLQSASSAYDLTGSYAKVKMTMPSGGYSALTLTNAGAGNDISAYWTGGTLSLGVRTAYTFGTPGTVAVSAGSSIYVGVGEGVAGASHFGGTGTAGNIYWYTSTNGSTWTERKVATTPSYVASLRILLEAGESAATTTFDNFNVAGTESYTGSGSLSGSGTVTSVQVPNLTRSATLTGSGTLTGAASVSFSSTRSLTGSGTLTAAGKPAYSQSTSLSGSGTLSVSGTPAYSRSVALSGAGTLSSARIVNFVNTTNLNSTGTLTSAAGLNLSVTRALSGSGTLSGAQGTISLSRAVGLSGTGTPTFSTQSNLVQTGQVTGSGLLSVAGVPRFSNTTALNSAGTLTSSTEHQQTRLVNLSGLGGLTAVATNISQENTVNFSGTGSLGLQTTSTGSGSFEFAGAGTLSGELDTLNVITSISQTGSGNLSAIALVNFSESADFTGSGELTSEAEITQSTEVNLLGIGNSFFNTNFEIEQTSGFVGFGTLSVVSTEISQSVNVTLSGSGTFGFQTAGAGTAEFTSNGSGGLSAEAFISFIEEVNLDSSGQLTADLTNITQAVEFSTDGNGNLLVAVIPQIAEILSSNGTGTLTATASAESEGATTVGFAGTGSLSISDPFVQFTNAVELSGNGAFGGTALLERTATVNLASTGTLTAALTSEKVDQIDLITFTFNSRQYNGSITESRYQGTINKKVYSATTVGPIFIIKLNPPKRLDR